MRNQPHEAIEGTVFLAVGKKSRVGGGEHIWKRVIRNGVCSGKILIKLCRTR